MEVCYNRGSFSSYLYEIRFIILFYVIGDWASTVYALPQGMEYNPVPAMILENYGIYHLLLVKVGFIFLLFYAAPMIKASAERWAFTKHIIESVGLFVTVNNLMVVWYGNSLIQAIGLVGTNQAHIAGLFFSFPIYRWIGILFPTGFFLTGFCF